MTLWRKQYLLESHRNLPEKKKALLVRLAYEENREWLAYAKGIRKVFYVTCAKLMHLKDVQTEKNKSVSLLSDEPDGAEQTKSAFRTIENFVAFRIREKDLWRLLVELLLSQIKYSQKWYYIYLLSYQ